MDAMRSSQPSLRLAPMTAADLPAVDALERASFSHPWDIEAYAGELANPSAFYQVAYQGGQLVGFGGIWIIAEEAHIVTLAVDAAVRRQGIGRCVILALMAEARGRGVQRVTLEVRAGNAPAQGLYRSLGFAQVARRRHYYPDNGEDALVMALVFAAA
jgi:ribosomal-protein-alanine N-acetyltransferase